MQIAAAGTSTITPVLTSSPKATPSRRRLCRVSLTSLFTYSSSSRLVIMGKSIETWPCRAGAEDRPDLGHEELGVLEEDAGRPPSHERVGLAAPAEVGDGLVAAQVERADRDRLVGRVEDDLAIVLVLLLLAGHVVVGEEEVLGPEQPDARGADLLGGLGIGEVVDVRQQLDPRPVGAERGLVAIGDQAVLDVEELALDLAIGGGRLLVGPDDDHPVAAVDDHQVAALDVPHDALDPGDRRDAAAPGQDGRMAGRAADLGHDARRSAGRPGSSPGWAGSRAPPGSPTRRHCANRSRPIHVRDSACASGASRSAG